jgi:hypothetical protein
MSTTEPCRISFNGEIKWLTDKFQVGYVCTCATHHTIVGCAKEGSMPITIEKLNELMDAVHKECSTYEGVNK